MDETATVDAILEWLSTRRSNANIIGMGRYGINTDRAFGVSNADLRPLARQIGRNHQRALDLWQTGLREARLLAAFTEEKTKVTPEQARSWAADFNSWEIVDGVSDLFADTDHWLDLIHEFAADEREFMRRTAFAMMAWASVHRKKEPDSTFVDKLMPIVEMHATDPRNFVKKAVNWALRNIGKRSLACHAPALALAERLAGSDDKTARWIGKDAVRELSDPKRIAMIGQKKTAANKAKVLGAMR